MAQQEKSHSLAVFYQFKKEEALPHLVNPQNQIVSKATLITLLKENNQNILFGYEPLVELITTDFQTFSAKVKTEVVQTAQNMERLDTSLDIYDILKSMTIEVTDGIAALEILIDKDDLYLPFDVEVDSKTPLNSYLVSDLSICVLLLLTFSYLFIILHFRKYFFK